MAEVEGQSEDTGGVLPRRVLWFFRPCSLPEPGVESPGGGGGDLEEKMEEERYFSGCPPTPLSLDGIFAFMRDCSDI